MFTSNYVKNLLLFLAFIFFMGFLFYLGTSIVLIINQYPLSTFTVHNYISLILNFIILIFESITAVYGIFLFLHTALVFGKRNSLPESITLLSEPLVSLIIPTFNPNLYALETNLLNIQHLSYTNKEIFVTDNSNDESIVSSLEELCKMYDVSFIHRDGLQGFKARNLNNALKQIKGEYFIIIDTDQSLKDQSIEKFLFDFQNSTDDKLAFVQGRFEIKNANSVIRTSIAILYTFFYDVISLAKSSMKSVLFNGSSGCFKTKIVEEINGFPENCYTEDIAISNELLSQGYHSLYLNDSVTTALVPWKLGTLLSSFWRWTHGGTSCLNIYKGKITSSRKITYFKKIELLMNTLSFVAISSILIIIVSMLGSYWLNVQIIRPDIKLGIVVIPLFLFYPTFTSINHLLNCLIGMWESETLFRLPYLIPYSIASIAISLFIVLPSFYALINVKGPDTPGSQWNKEFHTLRVSTVLFLGVLVFSYSMYDAFLKNKLIWLTFGSMTLVCTLTILFLLKDYRINVFEEEMKYFRNFRKMYNFKLD